MIYLLYALHVIVCIFLILVVLLQQGKGADLSVFGGGSTQTAFGARGATTLLHKLTVTSFVIFILTTLAISIFQGGSGSASVMSNYMEQQQKEQTHLPGTNPPAPGAKAAPVQRTPAAPVAPAPAAPPPANPGTPR